MSRADHPARGDADLRRRQVNRVLLLHRGGGAAVVPVDPSRALPEVEQFGFSVQVQETVSLVLHVALYAHGRGFRGAAVEAFVPRPDLQGQVPYEALHVYHHLRVWNGHSVRGTHVFKVRCEAGVVACEALAAEETLEGRCALLALVVRNLLVTAVAAAVSAAGRCLSDVFLFLDLILEFIEGHGW